MNGDVDLRGERKKACCEAPVCGSARWRSMQRCPLVCRRCVGACEADQRMGPRVRGRRSWLANDGMARGGDAKPPYPGPSRYDV